MTQLYVTRRRCESGSLNRGFTLIELMLVVVMLGVLAGIVMASFGNPASQTREVALAAALRNLRTQVMTYRLQHRDTLPDGLLLMQQLTGNTDVAGNVGVGAAYPLGPYFQSPPTNPFNGRSDAKPIAPGLPLEPDDTTGWLYQSDGNRFSLIANSSQTDTSGRSLTKY